MQETQQLAQPDDNAKAHSQQLLNHIINQIKLSGGKISFEEYMQLALYAPGLGYYSAGLHKFGKQGDFITAPEISPLFGQVLAIQAKQILKTVQQITDQMDILEVGAGSGKMAADILIHLMHKKSLPDHYYILELSADLIQRQKHYLKEKLPEYFEQIIWLDCLPKDGFNGLVIANELLDAFPVHLVKLENNRLYERFVSIETNPHNNKQQLGFVDCLVNDLENGLVNGSELFAIKDKITTNLDKNQDLVDGNHSYITEVNTLAKHWINSIAKTINCGGLLLIDYGYPESEYLHPQRHMGTLMCHYRHKAHDQPFFYPGLQDITAHVNFTDIKNAAQQSGLDLQGYTTQAHFLLAGGLVDLTQHIDVSKIKDYAIMATEIKLLTLPEEMGELFKVIYFSKNIDTHKNSGTLSGFSFNNMRDKL